MTAGRQKEVFLGICLGLIVGLMLAALPSGMAHARAPVGEGVLPEYYPHDFDGMGRIDRIAKEGMVIDDSFYTFSGRVSYATLTMRSASSANFHVGDYVGFVTDSDNKITGIWLFQEGKR